MTLDACSAERPVVMWSRRRLPVAYRASVTLPQRDEDEVSLVWRVRAKDVAGNELTSSYVTLRIDTAVPVFTDAFTGHARGERR